MTNVTSKPKIPYAEFHWTRSSSGGMIISENWKSRNRKKKYLRTKYSVSSEENVENIFGKKQEVTNKFIVYFESSGKAELHQSIQPK